MAINFKCLNWKRRKGFSTNTRFAEFGTKQYMRLEATDIIEYFSKPLRCTEGTEWTFETRVKVRRINGK